MRFLNQAFVATPVICHAGLSGFFVLSEEALPTAEITTNETTQAVIRHVTA
jgi:hypothetical protein